MVRVQWSFYKIYFAWNLCAQYTAAMYQITKKAILGKLFYERIYIKIKRTRIPSNKLKSQHFRKQLQHLTFLNLDNVDNVEQLYVNYSCKLNRKTDQNE